MAPKPQNPVSEKYLENKLKFILLSLGLYGHEQYTI